MSAPKDHSPAFPLYREEGDGYGNVNRFSESGMALRDYFAAHAMQGWLASFGPDAPHPAGKSGEPGIPEELAAEAYALADAMMIQRAQ